LFRRDAASRGELMQFPRDQGTAGVCAIPHETVGHWYNYLVV
jgi:hypothetical protein